MSTKNVKPTTLPNAGKVTIHEQSGMMPPPQANNAQAQKENAPPISVKMTPAQAEANCKATKAQAELDFKAGKIDAGAMVQKFNEADSAFRKYQKDNAEDIAKAMQAENERLAKARGEYEVALTASILKSNPDIAKKLAELKVTGAHINLEPFGVKLAVPQAVTIKRKAGGVTGTRANARQSQFGGLDETFNAIATEAEKAEVNAVETNSAKWSIKNRVYKAGLASGKVTPKT